MGKLWENIKEIPTPVKWGLAGIAAVVIYLYISSQSGSPGGGLFGSSNSSSQGIAPVDANGLAMLPPGVTVSGGVPVGYQQMGSSSGFLQSPVFLGGTQQISSSNPVEATVRTAQSSGTTSQYDLKHTGVPIRTAAGGSGSIKGYAPFGSGIEVVGAPIVGTSNFPSNGQTGSDLWYPVAGGGYVSGYDLNKMSLYSTGNI